ncbi:CUTA protein, partial [Nothocercus nigrocapillus]|nr:CUTA protein [Nothocercus nigrocapillus]
AMALSFLMYPVLRSLALQVHSAVTGSYISGTHSVAFINCLNEQIAKDIARYSGASTACLHKLFQSCFSCNKQGLSLPLLQQLYFSDGSEVLSIHPFEIPEVISLPIDQGNPFYFKWLEESMARD